MTRAPDTMGVLMTTDVVTVAPDATVRDALRAMIEHDIGSVVVAEGGAAIGVFTERDVTRHVLTDAAVLEERVHELSTSPQKYGNVTTPARLGCISPARETDAQEKPIHHRAERPGTRGAGSPGLPVHVAVSGCRTGQDRAHGGCGPRQRPDRGPSGHPPRGRLQVAQTLLHRAARRPPGATPARTAKRLSPPRESSRSRRSPVSYPAALACRFRVCRSPTSATRSLPVAWWPRSRARPSGAGWPRTRSAPGPTAAGSSPAPRTLRPGPPACWTCTRGSGRASRWTPTTT